MTLVYKTDKTHLQYYCYQKTISNVNKFARFLRSRGHLLEVHDIQKRNRLLMLLKKELWCFNYLGHGGEDGLSSERIWEKSGQNLSNQYKYLYLSLSL
jgi:hypothetical protein